MQTNTPADDNMADKLSQCHRPSETLEKAPSSLSEQASSAQSRTKSVDVKSVPTIKLSSSRGQLGAVRSLESVGTSDDGCDASKPSLSSLPTPSTSGVQTTGRQIFSLKQLALSSKNLAKKRVSVQETSNRILQSVGRQKHFTKQRPESANQELSAQRNQDSGSNTSLDSSPENCYTPGFRRLSKGDSSPKTDNKQDRDQSLELVNQSDDEESNEELYDDVLEDSYDECEQGSGESEQNQDPTDNELSNSDGMNDCKNKRLRKRRSSAKRLSCCKCEPTVTKIDYDGQPVTDVDLVTYKDLCQMEHQVHHLRIKNQQHLDIHSVNAFNLQGSSMRRSSLQEESGAYYQLCMSGYEQEIRQKYVWFPPSLKKISLVDRFFADFPKEKIPLVDSGTSGKAKSRAVDSSCSNQAVARAVGSSHPGVGSLTSSYRDEQISVQLPRQDMSLDYCVYPMSDTSRNSYLQFINKRNSQALDVGKVFQVKLNFTPQSARPTQSGCPMAVRSDAERQHKGSTVSQSALLLMELNQSQEDKLGQHVGGSTQGSQRCRRCLVRFEDKQLAVAAPKFIIGSILYRSLIIPGSESSCRHGSPSAESQASGRVSPAPNANVALFHPTCFSCSICKEFLVDLVYCLRDNKLYCVRHYGESMRPRCYWCQELIFSDEYLKAMNENFHVDHFLCRHCHSNLAGQRYVLKDEKPFCIQCYEGNFAHTCQDCRKPIGIDSRDLSYKERHWHDTCFLCHRCHQLLIDKPFGSKMDKVYCADCYELTFATRCDGCKNPFRTGSKKMEYRGRQWHDSCFCCCVCQNTIGSDSFIPKNDDIYCIKCYEDKYATRCTKCKQVIVNGGVTFRNEPWHRECFNCCNCNKSLAGQRFTTRDVSHETVNNTNKTNQPHNAYCIDCYGDLFAKKCYSCAKAITGLGGTRFVTFEDRSWHNDCFICHDCNISLVGKGFITDGPETILCGECARAKLR